MILKQFYSSDQWDAQAISLVEVLEYFMSSNKNQYEDIDVIGPMSSYEKEMSKSQKINFQCFWWN